MHLPSAVLASTQGQVQDLPLRRNMEKMPVDGLTIFFPAEERSAAELVRQACEKSISLIRTSWGLETPEDVRVYVLTASWLRATFHSAPWRWRPLMVLSLPVWYPRGRRLWRVAGGWQQSYGRRCAVCVKTPRLLAQEDSSIGDRIFISEAEMTAKVQQITCHELTHAFTAHLKLPAWLNEGLAMVTAERFAGKPMVRRDSLVLLEPPMAIRGSSSRQAAKSGGLEAVRRSLRAGLLAHSLSRRNAARAAARPVRATCSTRPLGKRDSQRLQYQRRRVLVHGRYHGRGLLPGAGRGGADGRRLGR